MSKLFCEIQAPYFNHHEEKENLTAMSHKKVQLRGIIFHTGRIEIDQANVLKLNTQVNAVPYAYLLYLYQH